MAVAEKALGEGPGGGGAPLVPPVYMNGVRSRCPKCGSGPVYKSGKCSNCGYKQTPKTDGGGEGPTKEFRIDFDMKSVTENPENGTLIIEGYGSTWVEDRDEESVAKEAFTQSLDEYMTNPVVLLDHDKHKPIGTVTKAWTDAVGLFVIAEIPKPTKDSEGWHHKAYADIKRGIRKAFSIGGKFIRDASRKFIERVHLYELSVVSVPANPTSLFSVVGIKEWASKTPATGVGRGHGRHHRGPVGNSGPRARHRHANGVRHRHRLPRGGGYHVHRRSKALESDLAVDLTAYELEDPDDGEDLLDEDAEGEIEHFEEGLTLEDWHRLEQFGLETKAKWSTAYINDLPDSSFAYIEEGGEKDDEGKTTPRSKRHFPYKDADGKIDLPHLRNALARAPQSPFGDKAMPKLRAAARSAGVGDEGRELAELGTKGGTVDNKDDKKDVIEVDAKEWERTQMTVRALADEKEARDKQAAIEAEAKSRFEREQEEAKKEAELKAARQKEINDAVEEKLKALRAGASSGRKHVWTGSGAAGGEGRKDYRLSAYMLDLVRAKKGDFDAFKRLKDQDEEAATGYKEAGYDIKAYGEGTSASGGFLVPPQYLQSGIAEYRIAQAKVRQLCTIIRGVNSNSVLIPRETGISTTGWTAENAAKPSTDATFGQISVGIYTLAGIAKVSRQLLEDSSPAVDMIVRRALGKSLGQQEDLAFINGTGSGMPTGVLQTSGVLTGAVGTKLWSSIAGAIATIQSNYFGNPTAILAHPRDVNTLRTTTDTAGRPIFLPNYWAGANPAQGASQAFLGPNAVNEQGQQFPMAIAPDGYVFGLPVYSDANIPTNLGAGTNETRMIIAAWDEAYVFDRVGMNMDVSSEAGTSFEQNQIWFRAEERVGFTAARQPSAFYVMTGLTPGAGL